MKSFEKLAGIAYEANCAHRDSAFLRNPFFVPFDELDSEDRSAWIASAKALWEEFAALR